MRPRLKGTCGCDGILTNVVSFRSLLGTSTRKPVRVEQQGCRRAGGHSGHDAVYNFKYHVESSFYETKKVISV